MTEERIYNLLVKESTQAITASEQTELNSYRTSHPTDVDATEHILKHTSDLKYPSSNEIEAGWKQLEHVIADDDMKAAPNQQSRFSRRNWMAMAASFLLLAAAYFVFNSNDSTSFAAIDSPLKQSLADGSEIIFNKGSEGSLKAGYGDDHRDIAMSGEVYISATKSEVPLTISSENLKVEVLGTRFNMSDYATDPVATVTLYEGKIALTLPDGSKLTLEAGDHVCWNKETQQLVKSTVDSSSPSWPENRIVFNNTPFLEVFSILSREFNVQFKGLEHLEGMHHYTDNNDDDELDTILTRIEKATNTRIKKKSNGIYVIDHQ